MTESGWRRPAWPFRPAGWTRPPRGWTAAPQGVPRTRPSGEPDSTARAVGGSGEVRRALRHLPAALFTQGQQLSLRAWLASHRGDRESERQALEQLVAIEPGDTEALDRLALLAWEAGRHDRAREDRGRKARADAAKDRYRLLLEGTITPALFAELAGLADSLGRSFEAQGWWTLQVRYQPADRTGREALARSRWQADPLPEPAGLTLAQRFADADPDLEADRDGRSERSQSPGTSLVARFADRADASGLQLRLREWPLAPPPAPRDDLGRRRPARLRRRRLARRLRRPGRRLPAGDPRMPATPAATGCSATGATGRSRT